MKSLPLLELNYTVEEDGDLNFYLYIEKDTLEHLPISNMAKDIFSSFGVKIDRNSNFDLKSNWRYKGRDSHGEIICRVLSERLNKDWHEPFIPVFRFTGNVAQLDDRFKQRKLLIHIQSGLSREEDLTNWGCAIGSLVKFTFLAYDDHSGSSFFITQDHVVARSWLSEYSNRVAAEQQQFNKLNPENVMRDWYPDAEFRDELLRLAKAKLDEFVVHNQYNVRIPYFFVVPEFRLRMFWRAQNCIKQLTSITGNSFIMTLTVKARKKNYTILFPAKLVRSN